MIIPIQQCAFFLFAALLIAAAFMTVIARNPVRSALFLVLAFFAAAALWILLEAEFLGLVLILVYVGAVMTLFLFVIMMLNIDATEKQRGFVSYLPYAVITVAVLLAILIYALFPVVTAHTLISQAAEVSNTQALGNILYTEYAYPFEIVGVLLLVAIIASIALSTKEKRFNKTIPPEKQFNVKAAHRVRIIKMEPNKKR
ncbi:NADH-quinone oxidoreductase chain J [Candidatus Rickettsiella viridis]|uniref:NADH-quinone oxidoreductase subunit J n=1 Tax=Candidatus Rickettsiella viridis TaxID=676208 RepID=A0A2Z5UUZ5_9COXI|nr:NADH-quinone oxidoreductase subunit J [Candidatus Rickettsiella viridis]BBB15318.1 NADH-quinone oxidoreductase chain J [Candidatus Rickettsiella viridis]